MSFKLQDRIQGTKGLPGKHKRLLVAMAKRARNDGTNIYPAKETLGELAGVSERTAYRILDQLVEASAILKADSHTCSTATCPKGARHYNAPGNHWTQAYNINVAGLDEAALRLQNLAKHRQESRKPATPRKAEWHDILTLHSYGEWYDILSVQWGDKMAESGLPFWQAKQGYNRKPVPLGSTDESSVLTDGSEVVREGAADSLRSSATCGTSKAEAVVSETNPLDNPQASSADQKQNQPQEELAMVHWETPKLSGIWHARTGRALTADEMVMASDLIAQHGHTVVERVLDITLNRREKSAKMVWKRFKVFADNWQTNYDLSMAWVAVKKAKKECPPEIPYKFNLKGVEPTELPSLKEYFREHCKIGAWHIEPEELRATGATNTHYHAALLFCVENCRKVTKEGFISLLFEVMTGLQPGDDRENQRLAREAEEAAVARDRERNPGSYDKNPPCSKCKGSTYGSPQYEDGKPYCANCMKLPRYRRESGKLDIFVKDDIGSMEDVMAQNQAKAAAASFDPEEA